MLIGLTGEATCGKDAFADFLVEDYNFVKLGWADPLYEMALVLNPLLPVRWRDMVRNGWLLPMQHLSHIVDMLGWTKAKRIPSVRSYLQILGTEAVRENIGENAWIDASTPKILKHMRAGRHVVITNVRFPNEANRVIELGGSVVRIKRDGVTAVNSHSSDSGLAFQFAVETVDNSSTLDALRMEATRVFELLDKPLNGLDHDELMARWNQTVARAVQNGVEAVLKTVKPIDIRLGDFLEGHKVAIASSDQWPIEVVVDGNVVGEVDCEDGVLSAIAFLV